MSSDLSGSSVKVRYRQKMKNCHSHQLEIVITELRVSEKRGYFNLLCLTGHASDLIHVVQS